MTKNGLKSSSLSDEQVVDAKTLARICRLDVRTVLKLAEHGTVVRVARGRFALEQSLGNVIEHYRNRAAGREAQDGSVDIVKANAALRETQRRLNEIKIEQLEGELISLPEVQAVWEALALSTRQLFMSFPTRARFNLPHLTGADQQVLENLAHDMLTEVAFQGEVKLPEEPRKASA